MKQRLIAARGSRSQDEMAKLLGVHKNTYARWERGERDPSVDAVVAFAREGWSPLWLLTGEGPQQLPGVVPPDAAADSALVVARADGDAYRRRDARIAEFARGARSQDEPPPGDLHEKAFRMAIAAVDAGLDGGRVELPPDVKAEVLIHAYRAVLAALGEDEAAAPTTSEGVAP